MHATVWSTSHWSLLRNIIFQDLKGHVKMIADFLELKPSEELIEEIANKCEFQTMSKFKNSNIPEGMRMVTDVRDKHIMYRKGKNISTCTWSSADIRLLSSIWSGLNIYPSLLFLYLYFLKKVRILLLFGFWYSYTQERMGWVGVIVSLSINISLFKIITLNESILKWAKLNVN